MKELKKIILAEGLEYKELEDGTLMIQKKEREPFVLEKKKVTTDLSEIDRPYYIDSFGVAGKTDEFKMITKNHMPSKELCEGIIALQQLISFRDNFHEVNGRNTSKISKYVLRLGTSGWYVGNVHGRVTFRELFEFDNLTQAENFLKYHKDLFNELKKIY